MQKEKKWSNDLQVEKIIAFIFNCTWNILLLNLYDSFDFQLENNGFMKQKLQKLTNSKFLKFYIFLKLLKFIQS